MMADGCPIGHRLDEVLDVSLTLVTTSWLVEERPGLSSGMAVQVANESSI